MVPTFHTIINQLAQASIFPSNNNSFWRLKSISKEYTDFAQLVAVSMLWCDLQEAEKKLVIFHNPSSKFLTNFFTL